MDSTSAHGPVLFAPPPPHPFHAFPATHSFQSPGSQWSALDGAPQFPLLDGASKAAPPAAPRVIARPTVNAARKRSRDVFHDGDDAAPFAPALGAAFNKGSLARMDATPPTTGPGFSLSPLDAPLPTPVTEHPSPSSTSSMTDAEPPRPLKSARKSFVGSAPSTATLHDPATGLPTPAPTTPSPTAPDDLLTPASLALGVGWRELGPADADAPAVRGWTRFLANTFPAALGGAPRIVLRHAGTERLVVAGGGAWWLFDADLKEGRLVARDWAACVERLRSHPVMCADGEVLRAALTPGVAAGAVMATGLPGAAVPEAPVLPEAMMVPEAAMLSEAAMMVADAPATTEVIMDVDG